MNDYSIKNQLQRYKNSWNHTLLPQSFKTFLRTDYHYDMPT